MQIMWLNKHKITSSIHISHFNCCSAEKNSSTSFFKWIRSCCCFTYLIFVKSIKYRFLIHNTFNSNFITKGCFIIREHKRKRRVDHSTVQTCLRNLSVQLQLCFCACDWASNRGKVQRCDT